MIYRTMLTQLVLGLICIPCIGGQSTVAQNFRGASAKDAVDGFHESVERARNKYIKELEGASRIAIRNDDLDEALEIKKEIASIKIDLAASGKDVLMKTRRSLEDSTFTWNRPGSPDKLLFQKMGQVSTHENGSVGSWQAIEPNVVIIKFQENLFLLQFNEQFAGYRVKAFGPVKTLYTNGLRDKD